MKENAWPVFKPGLIKVSLLCLSFSFYFIANSQTVSGTVSDDTGKKLSDVTVAVKGTTAGVVTDSLGRFRISAAPDATLIFSYVGFNPQEVAVSGRSSFDVMLSTITPQDLGEVVITALGINKQARGLGYSATNVKSEELTINRTPNLLNALQGKVAGVNITSLGTGPAGTSKIRIRGQSSIGGQNDPLIVINGVPVSSGNFNAGNTIGGNANGSTVGVKGGGVYSDGGDGLSSINPDDIENMTILKGAPAAALYGSRAQNGVIMITTKTKGKGKGIGVTYNLNYTNDKPLDFTDYQKEYGQGEGGVRPTTRNPTSGQWSFGEKFAPGMTQILFDSLTVPYEPQGSRIDEFYRNGQNISNTITMDAGSEKGGMHLSLNNTDNIGIVPNNKFNRKSINLGFAYSLSDKFNFGGNINYSREINKNPPNIANQDNSIPTVLMAMANSMPLSVLKANQLNSSGNEYIYSRFMNRTNPYWVLSQQFHNINRDRVFGSVFVKYNILKWLFVQGRFGQDYWSRDEDVNNFPTGHASRPAVPGFANGVYTQEARRFRESNLDFLLSANREFGDFEATITAGGNQARRTVDINNVVVTDFFVRGLYTVQNGRAKDPIYDLSEQGINSLYSSAELSWRKTLYVNGTVRNDWFSTLSEENRSILYPSISGAYVFSETFKKPSWLSFGKIRLGYAEVGSDNAVGPYADQLFYAVNANLINNSAGTPVPIGSSGSSIPNPNLKPSRASETEVGLELRLFNNRVYLDFAAYKKITRDQIVNVQVSDASGFVNTKINSGRSENKGYEMLVTVVPYQKKDFSWEITANATYNKTKVLSIITETPGERITIGTHTFNGEIRHVVGEEMGQIAGYGYATDDKGQRIFQSNGLPLRTPNLVLFGSALPTWLGGFMNTFNYKGINLTIFIDFKLGNKMLSGTNFNAIRHGLHKMTLEGRVDSVLGDGVNTGGGVNTKRAAVQTYWEHLRSQQIVEPVIYDGGYWKLRQITLGYDFTRFVPGKWPIKGVKLDFVASNVLILKKWVDNIDPESFGFASDNQVGLESPGLPTTRALGFNLNIKF